MNNMVGLVERLYLPNKAILTKDSGFIYIKDVVYLTSKKNSVFAVLGV